MSKKVEFRIVECPETAFSRGPLKWGRVYRDSVFTIMMEDDTFIDKKWRYELWEYACTVGSQQAYANLLENTNLLELQEIVTRLIDTNVEVVYITQSDYDLLKELLDRPIVPHSKEVS